MLVAAVFIIYIGAYDKLLHEYEPLHWGLNWLMAIVTLAAGALLLAVPKNTIMVALSGAVWPIVYASSLGVDVLTRLCIGGPSSYCWPSKTDSFRYLILNNPNIAGGYEWKLWTGTMPTILILMAIAFVLSIVTLVGLVRSKAKQESGKPSPSPTETSSPSRPPKQ